MRADYRQSWSTYVLGLVVTVVVLLAFGVFNGRYKDDTVDMPFGTIEIVKGNVTHTWVFSSILMQQQVNGVSVTGPTEYACGSTADAIHAQHSDTTPGDGFHLARASCNRMHSCVEISVVTVKIAWFFALLGGTPVFYSAAHLLFIFSAVSIMYAWFAANEYWPVVANYLYQTQDVSDHEDPDVLIVLGVFVALTSIVHVYYIARQSSDGVFYPYQMHKKEKADVYFIIN